MEEVKLGFIGTGGMAGAHMNNLKNFDDVKFVEETRTVKRVVKKSGEDQGLIIYGKGKLVPGKTGGKAIGINPMRRKSLRL